jgi:hypothetical protein
MKSLALDIVENMLKDAAREAGINVFIKKLGENYYKFGNL